MYKVLLTCPPMINRFNEIKHLFIQNKLDVHIPSNFKQTLNEEQLLNIIYNFDIWIIGDDLATRKILEKSNLKMAIKWGVGTDNVDINACQDLNIIFTNTPNMFGEEVSDVAIGYLLMLTRRLHEIHYQVLNNNWFKPRGISLYDKKCSVIGYGNIGKILCQKLLPFRMNLHVYDPLTIDMTDSRINFCKLIEECVIDTEFIIVTCPLNKYTQYMINKDLILSAKKGVYIINVARGPIVKEDDLVELLDNGYVTGAALDVFEEEPLLTDSRLKKYNCILGSHNGSNTIEAVDKVNYKVLDYIINNI